MAKKTTKPKKTKKTTKPKKIVPKEIQEQRRQYKRIRDAISKIHRKLRKEGFSTVFGIDIKEVRNLDTGVLKDITPEYLRSKIYVFTGDTTVDINEFNRHPQYYKDMYERFSDNFDTVYYGVEQENDDDMYPPIYDDVLAEVKRYILSHNLDSSYSEKVVNMLMNVLDNAIARDGKEDVANRLMNADWEGAIDAPFRYNKRSNALTDDIVRFASILKDSPLNPSDLAAISDYSLSREEISMPHGSDL